MGKNEFIFKLGDTDKIEDGVLYAHFLQINTGEYFPSGYKINFINLEIYINNALSIFLHKRPDMSYDLFMRDVAELKKKFLSKNDLDWVKQSELCCVWLWCLLRFDYCFNPNEKIEFLANNCNNDNLKGIPNNSIDDLESIFKRLGYCSLQFMGERDLGSKKLYSNITSYLNIYGLLNISSKEIRCRWLEQFKQKWYLLYSKNNGVVIDWDESNERLSAWVWKELNNKLRYIPEKLFMPISCKERYLATQGFLLFMLGSFPEKEVSELINKIKAGLKQVIRREKEKKQKYDDYFKIELSKPYQKKLSVLAKHYNKRGKTGVIEKLIDKELEVLEKRNNE